MKIINLLLLLITLSFSYIWAVSANIDLTVSPIKYEIDVSTWSIVTKTATIFNRSNQTHVISTWKSDFISVDNTWNPHFVRNSENIFNWQELSNWIKIDTENFILNPGEKKDISFTITVPENATPGWHYWAIFFKNNNAKNSNWSQITINVDYWVLILVKVEWEIITKVDIDETVIINPFSALYNNLEKDKCFLFDFTTSKYDWKCIDLSFITGEEIEFNSADDEILDFEIIFNTLFKNIWNTHIKPYWTIKLLDINWKEINSIWKEIIKNDAWAIIWEKIVNYLPINDNWWNILPWSSRIFESIWRWFPYEWYDENWKKIIKYWSPEEFYTRENWLYLSMDKIEESLYFWERINLKRNHRKIKALINIEYENKDWELVEFNSAQEFYVDYKEKYKWINPYVSILWILSLFIISMLLLVTKKKKIKCINKACKKILNVDMKICPYCWTKQKHKKNKK